MEAKVIRSSDVNRCPIRSLLASHYRPNGSCLCDGEDVDWEGARRRFQDLLGDRETRKRPEGLSGKNIITPEFLGYVEDANGQPVEVTTGTGMYYERIYGLTWGDPDRDRSQMVRSLEEAVQVLGLEARKARDA